jgi:hypothetical protein
LNLEKMPFEYIKSIDFGSRMLQGSVFLETNKKKIIFRSVSDANLKKICEFVKEKINSYDSYLKILESSKMVRQKPYMHPSWRPHHATYLPKLRHTKYYGQQSKTTTG